MVCFKEIKEYSKRKRINIIKNDGFNTGDAVVVLSKNDYESLINENKKLKHELEVNTNTGFDNLLEIAVKPITNNYDKQIKQLQKQLKEKEKELNQLKAVYTKFIADFSSLSIFDVLIRKRQHEIIKEFQSSIWLKPDQVAEIPKHEHDRESLK